jgi:hypothetical protein
MCRRPGGGRERGEETERGCGGLTHVWQRELVVAALDLELGRQGLAQLLQRHALAALWMHKVVVVVLVAMMIMMMMMMVVVVMMMVVVMMIMLLMMFKMILVVAAGGRRTSTHTRTHSTACTRLSTHTHTWPLIERRRTLLCRRERANCS